jgi:hypothetical protein
MFWSLRRIFGLSPTQQVFRELSRRGVRVNELRALELFAHSGFLHTKDYLSQVASLEAWEIDPRHKEALRQNLPSAEVKITDSYQEIKRTARKYNLIVLDTPECVHGDHGQYCEHFSMLPAVFPIAQDSTVLILNVMTGYGNGKSPRRPLFTDAHLEQRRRFYGTDHPETVRLAEMIPVYRRLVEVNGFELEWYFFHKRTRDGRLYYLVLKLRRRDAAGRMPRFATDRSPARLCEPPLNGALFLNER